jgi:hypothetical protein
MPSPSIHTEAAPERSRLQSEIERELEALEKGELRTEAQVQALAKLLPDATAQQIARAERLQVALLAEGHPLKELPVLGIEVTSRRNGTKDISYYEILPAHPSLTPSQLNPTSTESPIFTHELPMRFLGNVEDARGISPRVHFLHTWDDQQAAERVLELIGHQSRVTYHNDLPITWDKNIDGKAWSTNIDTVYFSDWLRECGALSDTVKVAVEVGCGAGGISQNVLSHCGNLERLIFTDIDPNAINCARRNLKPLASDTQVSWVIGKGIDGIAAPGTVDLLVSNPPYIPTPSGDGDKDHYSGTKLIRRLFRDGIKLLNPDNLDAAMYVQMSSVTLPDFERYCSEHPDVEVSRIGTPVRVPLRISGLLREPHVLDFVMKQGGLEYIKDDPLGYYHEIMAYRLRPKRGVS